MEDNKNKSGDFQKMDPGTKVSLSIIISAIIISVSMLYSNGKLSSQTDAQNLKAAPKTATSVKMRNDAPTLGSASAKVTIVEFSDFQCPYCQKFINETYPQIKKQYIDTGKAKIVFRHFPLSFHVNAQKSAEASECANRQGKFWEYHDILFKNGQPDGTGLDNASLKKYAEQVGLDTAKFNSCLNNGETASIVKADFADGQAAGVSGTPTFYINGTQVVGALPFQNFSAVIDPLLK